ncbi:hypothetical protein PHLCEN_2v12967 [Hermanssonia centrifuga]|uniref:Proline dehydrogenase n=1 Tax=Hermanssonia centrifuga TaxID=98765 RepID=A0A2R6NFM8_9APHY|nr:hypothetical protein PHLCEN_2v12967 [Hermanssonia centrifuga]
MHNAASLPGSKHEHSLSISPDALPPVWSTKQETDTCYNECARLLIETLAADIKNSNASRQSHSWSSLFGLFGSNSGRSKVPTLGILFGTHNWTSCRLVLDELLKRGLASVEGVTVEGEPIVKIGGEVTERLTMAQLYGMHDHLTNYLVERTRTSSPFVIKYVPYGSLKDVMPYLSRRAIENKSVLGEGAAIDERQRAWALIRGRVGF